MTTLAPASAHTWKFYRIGGLDQVALETGADLLHLHELDQKLWVALSCPVKGLELDEKTLALIDTDNDGRIRVPELVAAVQWAARHLKDAGELLQGRDTLMLAALDEATPEGKLALAAARQILASLGKADAANLSLVEVADTAKVFAAAKFNGDGVIPASSAGEAGTATVIGEILATLGGETDRNGQPGVSQARVDAFFVELAAFVAWAEKGVAADVAVLGDQTATAFAAIKAVRAKVDDFFVRCRLAAYDGRALTALNHAETEYLSLTAKDLASAAPEIAGFPLARIAAGRTLPLFGDVNPAWATALVALHRDAVAPTFEAAKTALTEADWAMLKAKFTAFEVWEASKAGAAVEKLGLARARAILASKSRETITALIAQDQAVAAEFEAIATVERLLRFHRDLRALLSNFVNFFDFYSRDCWAVFQAGTLYLDSRSTELCLRVDSASPLAAMSKTYIAYCVCTRSGGAAMNIAACFTQGDSDYLFVGRHGVFYDRAGRDWDAVITGIVDNPISIRQAFWSPYKKFVRMVEEQVAKRAAAAESESAGKLATTAEKTVNADKSAAATAKKIDVGTVAALGVAVGAIGGALGAIATGLAHLAIWQLPLVVACLILIISLPSMAIAALKLHQRTLGPILEGNGWAVNGRVKINIPFGSALTDLAALPPGAHRSLADPYEDKEAAKRRRQTFALIVVLALAAGAIWIRWDATEHRDANRKAHYFWEEGRPAPAAEAAPAVPAPAAAIEPKK
jgi:hypothetical protein